MNYLNYSGLIGLNRLTEQNKLYSEESMELIFDLIVLVFHIVHMLLLTVCFLLMVPVYLVKCLKGYYESKLRNKII